MVRSYSPILALGIFALLVALGARTATTLIEPVADPTCKDSFVPERPYRKVIDQLEQTETLVIEGSAWNDVLISNCHIHDVDGDGIIIRNVENLTILGCNIRNVSENGIRLRSSGSTDGVHLIDNRIMNVSKSGITAAKRSENAIDHTRALLLGNTITDSGLSGASGRGHGIYSQVSDVRIIGNTISGTRGGNGISIRSSGLVACNLVEGVSRKGKPGIRYYPDHKTGPSRTLEIRNNRILDAEVGIDLHAEVDSNTFSDVELVQRFIIIDNLLGADIPVRIHPRWQNPAFETIVAGNKSITP